ncbi:MAG: phage head closure protein [Candidatus Aminicenantes bacterium]|nr:phage head closure protein [Candidatus Aminicenantes bacterium]
MAISEFRRFAFPEIGELRQRVIFQAAIKLDDGYGGKQIVWQDAFSVWALIEPLSAHEKFEAMSVQSGVTHRVYIRFRRDVNTEMRIKYGDRIFEIDGIFDVGEQKKFLELLCSE